MRFSKQQLNDGKAYALRMAARGRQYYVELDVKAYLESCANALSAGGDFCSCGRVIPFQEVMSGYRRCDKCGE